MVIHHLRPSWDDPPSRNKPTNPSEQWKKGPLVVCWVYVVDEILPSYIGIGLFHQPFFLDPVIKQPGFSWLAYHCAPPWPKCSKHNGVSRKLLEPPWPSCFWLVVVGCFQPLRILGMSFFGVKKTTCFLRPLGSGCHERRVRGVSIGGGDGFFLKVIFCLGQQFLQTQKLISWDRYIYPRECVFLHGKLVGEKIDCLGKDTHGNEHGLS